MFNIIYKGIKFDISWHIDFFKIYILFDNNLITSDSHQTLKKWYLNIDKETDFVSLLTWFLHFCGVKGNVVFSRNIQLLYRRQNGRQKLFGLQHTYIYRKGQHCNKLQNWHQIESENLKHSLNVFIRHRKSIAITTKIILFYCEIQMFIIEIFKYWYAITQLFMEGRKVHIKREPGQMWIKLLLNAKFMILWCIKDICI